MGVEGGLSAVAITLTRHEERAEDLVADTRLRALRYFRSYEPGRSFFGWAVRIMQRLWINERGRVRRLGELAQERRPAQHGSEDEVELESLADPSSLSAFDRVEDWDAIRTQLRVQYADRDLATARILQTGYGYTLEEIDAMLGQPKGYILKLRVRQRRKGGA